MMVAANCLTAIDVQCQRSLSIEQCDITAIICSEPEEQVDSRPININQCFATLITIFLIFLIFLSKPYEIPLLKK